MSIRELFERLCRVLDKDFESSVEVVGDRLGKDSAYWLNSDKLRSRLGWEEKISLEHGLEATMAWVKDNLEALQQQPLKYVHKP
jgi:dTDP-glucose 4,6-dehydratase